MSFILGCCVSSQHKYQTYVESAAEKLDATGVGFGDSTNIAVTYNALTLLAREHLTAKPDALVLLHDDLEITDEKFELKVEEAFAEENVELLGVAGGRGTRGLDWWSYSPIGHQWLEDQLIDFTQREGEVDGLEGSIMILSPWVLEHLTFDESYGGFYGYDCDLPQQVVRAGKKVKVVDIDTVHHSQLGFKTPALRLQFGETNAKFRAKWGFS